MRGHVVRPFVVMLISGALGSEAVEVELEVTADRRRGILLDEQ
jgi:hypothetical protein